MERIICRIYYEDLLKAFIRNFGNELETTDIFIYMDATRYVYENLILIDKENTIIRDRLAKLYYDYYNLVY